MNQTVLADGVNRPRGWLGRGMSDNVFVTSAQLPDKLTGALSKENMTMAYNRESACQYAWKHWNTVCDDGCVAMNNGQKSSLLKLPAGSDITQLPLNNQDDCTHFVSCCIGKGGGLLLGLWDMFPAYGVLSPDRLLKRLTTEMQVARVVGQNLAAGDATEKLYKGALQRGDVILYNIPQPPTAHGQAYTVTPPCTWATARLPVTRNAAVAWTLMGSALPPSRCCISPKCTLVCGVSITRVVRAKLP